MTSNKDTVERYLAAFRTSSHEQILDCLTDDVEWIIPGMFHLTGKDAFDAAIEHEDFVGSPEITLRRLTEEADVVVAEGSVRSPRRDGGVLEVVFCDVFEMRDARIRRLTSYLAQLHPDTR